MTSPDPGDLLRLARGAWQEALGHEDFTDDDTFFMIGGHSLAAIRVMTALSDELGVRLPVRLLFRNRTLASFAPAVAAYLASQTADQPTDVEAASS